VNLRHRSLSADHVLSCLQLLLTGELQIFVTPVKCIFRSAQESLFAQLKYKSSISNQLWFHLLLLSIYVDSLDAAVESVWIHRF